MRIPTALLAFSILASSFALKQNGYTYENQQTKMSIDFPAQFEVTKIEKEKSINYKAKVQIDGMLFLATSAIHVKTLENDIDGFLETSITGFKESLKGTIVSTESIELNGARGRFVVMTLGENKTKLEYRVILKGNKQYQIISAQLGTEYDQAVADEFYDSFKILK